MSNNNFFLSVLMIKLLYMFIGVTYLSSIVQLGDSKDYLMGVYTHRNDYTSPAFLMSITGSFLNGVFGSLLSNIPAVLIATLGFVAPVNKLHSLGYNVKNEFLIISALPAVGVWTSIHSKDVVIVFSIGMIVCYFMEIYGGNRKLPNIVEIIAIALLVIFKPLLLLTLVAVFYLIFLFIKSKIRRLMLVLIPFLFLMGLSFYYMFSEIVFQKMSILPAHFAHGSSSRSEVFWNDSMDILIWYIPGGFISMFGASLTEATTSLKSLVIFAESLAIFLFLTWKFIDWSFVKNKSTRLFFLLLLIFIVFFTYHYPYGLFNPGSSIRYRADFLYHMIFIFYMTNIFYRNNVNIFKGKACQA